MTDKPANHKVKWSKEDENFLLVTYAGGTSVDCIAEELDRTVVAIYGRLAKLGLVEFDKTANAYYTVRAKLYQF